MLWITLKTAQSTTPPIGLLRRRGSHERRPASFCRSRYMVVPRLRQHFISVLPNLPESDSSPSPSPSPSPPPTSAPAQGAQGGSGPSRTFPALSHSSGSGSSSPNLPVRTLRGDDEREGVATTEDGDRTYHLEVVQTPERTAEFGNAVLSRLPLAPALIVKLTVRDRSGQVIQIHGELPFLVAHLALLSENGSQYVDSSLGNDQLAISPSQRLLYGSLVSSPHYLQNQQGHPGIYFIFPDVNVRNCGRYRLKVSLLKIARPDGNHVINEGSGTTLVSTRTRVFEVVPQAEYVAPATTSLTQCFHRQGARMSQPFSRS